MSILRDSYRVKVTVYPQSNLGFKIILYPIKATNTPCKTYWNNPKQNPPYIVKHRVGKKIAMKKKKCLL
ncbi:MAG: hypothetical protein ABR84_04645 [Cryomorphaceae bacterium BACL21 MAG-121220-bin10]|jgi:hypothetical protein|nr:MAG: hypothetical protein ABR84_04645 [Cryomorphaceae bacterium BACL21 MAG-121220-bin10]